MPSDKDIVVEVRELLARSTPGPWKVYSDSRPDIVTTAEVNSGYMGERHLLSMDKYGTSWGQDFENEDDANLIARAPELLRALADEVERLRKPTVRYFKCVSCACGRESWHRREMKG